jgi:hypothetical protein
MMPQLVRITPDVVFNADVFPRVSDTQLADGPGKRAVRGVEPCELAVDPRQVDMFGDDVHHAPA